MRSFLFFERVSNFRLAFVLLIFHEAPTTTLHPLADVIRHVWAVCFGHSKSLELGELNAI